MSWYSIANEEVNLTIQEVMKKNHGDLHAEGVTITALIARSEEGPAIKVRMRGCWMHSNHQADGADAWAR